MAAFQWSYATLKAALVAFVEEQGTDFASNVDTCIGLGELGLLRDLDLDIFDATDTGAFSVGNQIILKPTGFVADRTLTFVSAGKTYPLIMKSREFVLDYWPTAATTILLPKYYCDMDTVRWMVAGTPSTALAWTALFMKRPDGLSSTTGTTWLGTNCPDALFYACLAYSAEYLKQSESLPTWVQEYQRRLQAAQIETRHHKRKDYAPMAATPTPRGER